MNERKQSLDICVKRGRKPKTCISFDYAGPTENDDIIKKIVKAIFFLLKGKG